MKNNIYLKRLLIKAGVAAVLGCFFIFFLFVMSCDLLDAGSSGTNDDPEPVSTEENEAQEDQEVQEEETPEESPSQDEPAEEEPVEDQQEEMAEAGEITINVYYSDPMAEYLVPESRIIPVENKLMDALYELMKKPIDASLTPLIPDTTIINSVDIEGGNAKVDLSQKFLDDRFVSDTVDILLVYSVVNTLTQFPEVNSVTFYIDGEKLDILGQLDVSDPVFRRNDLIKNN